MRTSTKSSITPTPVNVNRSLVHAERWKARVVTSNTPPEEDRGSTYARKEGLRRESGRSDHSGPHHGNWGHGVRSVGQTLGQTANFRQTTPEIDVSPGFADRNRCPTNMAGAKPATIRGNEASGAIHIGRRRARRRRLSPG